MKNLGVTVLFVLAIFGSCKDAVIEDGEDCSIKVAGVEFTRCLNKASSLVAVENDQLILKSNAKTDYFNEPDGTMSISNAPLLLLKIDNSKPFTFTAKVTPTFMETYDAGALYIYSNKDSWFKFAFERDERANTRAVTVRTMETSDDNNHDVIDSTSMFMKISSDTKNIGFYYSLDQKNWQLVRLFRNEYPEETWIGVSSQSPLGKGTTSTFEAFSFTLNTIKDFRLGI